MRSCLRSIHKRSCRLKERVGRRREEEGEEDRLCFLLLLLEEWPSHSSSKQRCKSKSLDSWEEASCGILPCENKERERERVLGRER